MPVGRAAPLGLILCHRAHNDTVGECHIAQLVRRKHRCTRGSILRRACLRLKPLLSARKPLWVAQPQVLVADPLRARQKRVVKLQGVHAEVALDLFKPLQRVARRRLQAQNLKPPLALITLEGAFHHRLLV